MITAPDVSTITGILEKTYNPNAYSAKNEKVAAYVVRIMERLLPDVSKGHLKYSVMNGIWEHYANRDKAEAATVEILGY